MDYLSTQGLLCDAANLKLTVERLGECIKDNRHDDALSELSAIMDTVESLHNGITTPKTAFADPSS